MTLGDIMTAWIVPVEMDDRLEVVKVIFDTVNFHHLLVLDENKKLGGIVSGSAAETARRQILEQHGTLCPDRSAVLSVQV